MIGKNLTIKRALVSAVLLGIFLPALLVGAYLSRLFYYDRLDREIVQTLQHNADILALGVRESLWAIDSGSAHALADAVMTDSPLVSVEILDPQLGRFVFKENPERRIGKIYSIDRAVTHRGEVIGRVRLEMSDDYFSREFRHQLLTQIGALTLQIICSVALILAVLQYRVGNPLRRLSREAAQLAKGELGSPINPASQDEIGEVQTQLETTRTALQNLFRALEQKNRALEVDLRERERVEATLRDREQRIRTLVDQNPLAVIEFDLEWHILDWNEAASKVFGWHKEEVLGRPIEMLRASNIEQDSFGSCATPRLDSFQGKSYLRKADGEIITCQWYNNTIRDSSGAPQRFVSVVEDITIRQRSDDEIRRLAAVVKMTNNLVAITNHSGHIQWANQAFKERFLSAEDELNGAELAAFLKGGPAESSSVSSQIQFALSANTHQHIVDLPLTARSGETFWASVEFQPVTSETGIVAQWLVVMTDVTRRHVVSEALRSIAKLSATEDSEPFLEQILLAVKRGTNASAGYVVWEAEDSVFVIADPKRTDSSTGNTKTHEPVSILAEVKKSGSVICYKHDDPHSQKQTLLNANLSHEVMIAEPMIDPLHASTGCIALFFSSRPESIDEIQSLTQVGASRAGVELSRQRTLDALRQSEQLFASIFHASPLPLALFRARDHQCVSINEAFRINFGEVEGNTADHISGANTYQAWIEQTLASSTESASTEMHLVTTTGDGRDCQVHARKLRINGEDNQLLVVVDVTQLLNAKREIEELNLSLEHRVKERTHDLATANAELEKTLQQLRLTLEELIRSEKLAALGALVAGIAHELNTPIGNSLIVASTLRDMNKDLRQKAAEGLRKTSLNEHIQETDYASDILVRNLERAAELITSFKQVAVDQTSSQRRSFRLLEVVNEIVVTMHPVLRKESHSVEVRIPAEIEMNSYPGPLGQVIANMLNNAVLHAFEGMSSGRITLEGSVDQSKHVTLTFRDNGKGIPAANLRKIFDPFFTTRLGREGTGLGLSIVHNIVTGVLGGSISVDSNEGEGTSFLIRIPLHAPAAE